MAGYSKGIVATRKFNENNKAGLGRKGDTKIRKVDNRESHVNALEAYLIDVNGKAGEEYAKRVGAGTINPFTGMPEYHDDFKLGAAHGEMHREAGDWTYDAHAGSMWEYLIDPDVKVEDPNAPDPYSYEALSDVTGQQLYEFDPKFGEEDVKYFQDIFSDKPFDFLDREKALSEKGLTSAYEDTMGALGSQQAALGTATSRAGGKSREARDIGISQAGFQSSGTVTQGYETQKKELFQDYTAGMKDIGRERASALETLTLGQKGAVLDFDKGTYAEKQRQLDEYWEMIGMRQQVR